MINIKIRRRYLVLFLLAGVFIALQVGFGSIIAKSTFLNLYPFRTSNLKTSTVILPDKESFYYSSVRRYVVAHCQVSDDPKVYLQRIINLTSCIRDLAENQGARPIKAERVTDVDFIKFFSKKENYGYYKLECAAFTSLLKAALTASGYYVRRVDLSDFGSSYGWVFRFVANFFPSSSHLIFYRHQALEIWDETQGKWIFWDGFYGKYAVSAKDLRRLPISAVDVQNDPFGTKFIEFDSVEPAIVSRYPNLFNQIAIGRVFDSEYEMQLHPYKDEFGPAYRSFHWRTVSASSVFKLVNFEFRDYFSEDEELKVVEAIRRHIAASNNAR